MRIPPSTCAFLFGAAFAFGAYVKARSAQDGSPPVALPALTPPGKATTATAAADRPGDLGEAPTTPAYARVTQGRSAAISEERSARE